MSRTPEVSSRAQLAWRALITILGLEAVGAIALTIFVVRGVFGENQEAADLGLQVSVLAATIISTIWVIATFAAALRTRASWVRASAITLHVLIFAAGTGVLQMGLADPLIGWGLVLLSFAGFAAALLAQPADRAGR